jgi:hypothetical protein
MRANGLMPQLNLCFPQWWRANPAILAQLAAEAHPLDYSVLTRSRSANSRLLRSRRNPLGVGRGVQAVYREGLSTKARQVAGESKAM